MKPMFVEVPDHLLHTVCFGDPDAMPFVAHGGWVGSWELWQQPFERLQPSWRCISYDHRGTGASLGPADSISPTALVDDLFRVLDHFEVERCVLAGESLGGLTVALAALREPTRFAGLVLVDARTAGSGAGTQHPLVQGARSDYPATVSAFADLCMPWSGDDHLRRWGRQIMMRADPESAARLLESHDVLTEPPGVEGLAMPTLVIHADNDLIVPLTEAQALAELIPDCRLVVLEGAGHVPTITQPDRVVDAIGQWWGDVAG